jgi:hypothetical protein
LRENSELTVIGLRKTLFPGEDFYDLLLLADLETDFLDLVLSLSSEEIRLPKWSLPIFN